MTGALALSVYENQSKVQQRRRAKDRSRSLLDVDEWLPAQRNTYEARRNKAVEVEAR